jgi:hypothetical protein
VRDLRWLLLIHDSDIGTAAGAVSGAEAGDGALQAVGDLG